MVAESVRHPGRFLVWVAVVSVPFYAAGTFGGLRVGALRLPWSALMFVLPVTVAAVLLWRGDGRRAVRRLLGRARDRPVLAIRRYVAVAAVFAGIAVVAWLVAYVAGVAGTRWPVGWAGLPVLVLMFAVAAMGEELGWTGYATDPLVRRFGIAGAGFGLGVFWAVWHLLPLWQAGHGVVWVAGWFVGTVAARVVIVWLYVRTGRAGVGVAVVAHTTMNVTSACTPDYDEALVAVVYGALLVVLAVAAVAFGVVSRGSAGRVDSLAPGR